MAYTRYRTNFPAEAGGYASLFPSVRAADGKSEAILISDP